ncbi:hypothetical protein [Haloferula sp.]|uniref:hypothetical protein n=1 Tax=Haloferula sp. TaxID=2497595 RepID=UPI003C74344A
MKRLLPLLFLGPALPLTAHDSEIPIGIEIVTGYRSDYVYRGFSLADNLIEIQIGGEVALSNQWLLDFGGWYGTGSDDFGEFSGSLGIRYDQDSWDAGFDAAWRSYENSFFNDGFDFGPFFNWRPNADWRIGSAVSYDTGPDGWYGEVEAEWSKPVGNSSFLSILGGASAVSNYYGRDGLNDFYSRLGYTYGVNDSVAFTPFVGASVPLYSGGSTRLFAGLWFEVNF